jgi:DUF1680 family protein
VGNFRAAVEGRLPADRQGVVFTDSDVYKLMEGAAWEVGRSSSDAERRFVELTGIIAPVQEEDGYLNTVFGRPGQPVRYSDLEWGHELYCYGHMLQAAVARGPNRARGRVRGGSAAGSRPRLPGFWPRWDRTGGRASGDRARARGAGPPHR